jgi:hypothetical protein
VPPKRNLTLVSFSEIEALRFSLPFVIKEEELPSDMVTVVCGGGDYKITAVATTSRF